MDHYFAYGSNLVLRQMEKRCPTFAANPVVVGRAVLRDYRLCYPVISHGDWAGGVAGIEPCAGHDLHGVIYQIDDQAIACLDIYEDVNNGLYRRDRVMVETEDGRAYECWTYFAIPQPGGPYLPSRKYLTAILSGAKAHGLPAHYLAELEQQAVCDG